MEQTGRYTPIDTLQEFLIKNSEGLRTTSMDFSEFFPSLKYAWKTNLGADKPKILDEFLKTSIYNATAKRIGLKKQSGTDLGQPGLEISVYPNEVSDTFYIEVYHWENKPGTEKPESPASRLGVLTGELPIKDEKLLDYLKRLASEQKATYSEEEKDGKKTIKFEAPLQGMTDFKAAWKTESVEYEKGYNLTEIALDIKVPYETIGDWLTIK